MTGTSGHPDADVRIKPGAGLASAMANFSVRTGLEIRPNSMGQVVVQSVRPDTPSARAGIEAGDIITNLNGTEITTIDSLQRLIAKRPSQAAYFASFRRGDHNFRAPLGRQLALLGMTLFPDPADRPVVKAVEPASPAERAGFKVGDVITGVDRQDTGTMAKLLDFAVPFMRNLSQGQGIPFRVVRDGKPLHFSVTRPADADLPILTPEQERHLRRVANGDEDRRPQRDQQRPRTRKITRTTQTTTRNQMNSVNGQVPNQNGYGAVGGLGGVGLGLDGGFGGAGLGTGGVGTTGMNSSSSGSTAAVAVLHGTPSSRQQMNPGQQTGNATTGAMGTSAMGAGVVGFVQIQANIGLNGQPNGSPAPGANAITGNTSTTTANPNAGATNLTQPGQTQGPQIGSGTNGLTGLNGTNGLTGLNGTNGLTTGINGTTPGSGTGGVNGTNGTNGDGNNNGNGNNSQSFVSAQISRVPPGTYTLAVNQFGDCGDSAGAAPGPSVFTLGTITVSGNGQGSLSQTINVAPQAFIGRTVSLVAAPTGGIGPVPGQQQSQGAQSVGQSNSGVVGCGKFRMSNQGNQNNPFIGGGQGGLGSAVGAPGATGVNPGTTGTGTGTTGTGTGTANPTAPGSITPPGGLPQPIYP
jgi:hypothetical protein